MRHATMTARRANFHLEIRALGVAITNRYDFSTMIVPVILGGTEQK